MVQFDAVAWTSFFEYGVSSMYLLFKERWKETVDKHDLLTTGGLVICAECDLLVEISHKYVGLRKQKIAFEV